MDSQTTIKMLNIFGKKKTKRNIFVDFAYMDEREAQYIRKMYEATLYYNQMNMAYNAQGFEYNQFGMMGRPLNLMNNVIPPPQSAPIMSIPPTMVRPQVPAATEAQRNNLGFQMNPVSKNKKK